MGRSSHGNLKNDIKCAFDFKQKLTHSARLPKRASDVGTPPERGEHDVEHLTVIFEGHIGLFTYSRPEIDILIFLCELKEVKPHADTQEGNGPKDQRVKRAMKTNQKFPVIFDEIFVVSEANIIFNVSRQIPW